MSSLTSSVDIDQLILDPTQQSELNALLALCHEYLEVCDDAMIERAFKLCYKAHLGLTRSSGEPYYLHPVEVASIVVREIGIDDVSVAAALLHDTVEDTEVTLDDISRLFGPEVRSIIDGLTKISGVFLNKGIKQAEAFMKLLLSMADDLRVVLIKFADRLHNMRTIQHLPRHKQLSIATETLELFAPLAHRFGLFKIKSELEDLSFKVIDPTTFKFIARKLKEKKEARELFIDQFMEPIRKQLDHAGFNFEIKGRPKHIYSIYKKMMRQQKPFEEIYDLFAIRIILDEPHTKEDCWRVYSFITDAYTPIPERFRDFISVPKANGYQSLHTTVITRSGKVEVQIRTQKMDEIAEMGLAAHWKYKEGSSTGSQTIDRFVHWVRDVLDNPRPEAITEFVQDFQLNLYTDEIYVFTPKGELVTLPNGSTPIDFAFEIHSQVGERAMAAKVNGKLVPLRQKLESGDQVEVITGSKINLNPDWMNDVVTHKAKSRIRQFIKQRERQIADQGRNLFEKKLDRGKVSIQEQDLAKVALKFKYSSLQKLYYDIATDVFDAATLYKAVKQFVSGKAEDERQKAQQAAEGEVQELYFEEARNVGKGKSLVVNGDLADIKYSYAQCCNPIPGDEVVGFLSRIGDIKIHRTGCKNALHLMQNDPDRIVNVNWSRFTDVQFLSGLKVIGEDRVGMISDITNAISKSLKTNMKSINVSSDGGMFEGILIVYVESTDHLERIIQRLLKVEGVKSVFRFE